MKAYRLNPIRIGRPSRLVSANLSIGTASAFVAATALLSLTVDKPNATLDVLGAGWTLRGAIGPSDPKAGGAPAQASARKVPRLT